MSRTLARERAFQLIYELEIQEVSPEQQVDWHFEIEPYKSEDERNYIRSTVLGVFENLELLDGRIEKHSKNWKISRISKVDLAILRLAVFEILLLPEVPDEVAANEAVELSKRYAEGSSAFVNGILSSIIREKEQEHDGE